MVVNILGIGKDNDVVRVYPAEKHGYYTAEGNGVKRTMHIDGIEFKFYEWGQEEKIKPTNLTEKDFERFCYSLIGLR